MRYYIFLFALFKLGLSFGQSPLNYQLGGDFGTVLGAKADGSKVISSIFLDISKRTNGEKYWQADHKYPQMGITLNVRNLHNYTSLSHVFSLVPYLEFNVLQSSLGELQIKHGTGLAWFTGDLNLANKQPVGSRLNAASVIDIGFEINTGKKINLKPGVSLFHQSNGGIIKPNNGLNTAAIYLQGRFYPEEKLAQKKSNYTKTILNSWYPELRLTLGLSQYNKDKNTMETNHQVLAMVGYQRSTRFRSSGGLEILFLSNQNNAIPSFYVEQSVLIGHLITKYGVGAYLNKGGLNENRIYEKVGVAYFPLKLKNHIGKGINIGTAIKAHGVRAANLDLSLGYLF